MLNIKLERRSKLKLEDLLPLDQGEKKAGEDDVVCELGIDWRWVTFWFSEIFVRSPSNYHLFHVHLHGRAQTSTSGLNETKCDGMCRVLINGDLFPAIIHKNVSHWGADPTLKGWLMRDLCWQAIIMERVKSIFNDRAIARLRRWSSLLLFGK